MAAIVGAGIVAITTVVLTRPPFPEGPRYVENIAFTDGDGNQRHIEEFRGRTVLLNLWATWCSPCRVEMPLLNQLQAELRSPDFEVIALALDRAGMDAVRRFLSEMQILNLAPYLANPPDEIMRQLGVFGMPATLLIDPDGREVFRVFGPAEWTSPEMVGRIRGHLAEVATRVAQ